MNKIDKKNEITTTRQKIKIVVVGVLCIALIIIGGCAISDYGAGIEAQIINAA